MSLSEPVPDVMDVTFPVLEPLVPKSLYDAQLSRLAANRLPPRAVSPATRTIARMVFFMSVNGELSQSLSYLAAEICKGKKKKK
jgi:hypothetical protein